MKIDTIYAVLFVAVLLFFVIGPLRQKKKLREDAIKTTEGRITGQEDVGLGDSSVWVDVVEYYAEGRYYKLKSKVSGKDTGGDAVMVHYVPGHPKKAWAERIPAPDEPETASLPNETDERCR